MTAETVTIMNRAIISAGRKRQFGPSRPAALFHTSMAMSTATELDTSEAAVIELPRCPQSVSSQTAQTVWAAANAAPMTTIRNRMRVSTSCDYGAFAPPGPCLPLSDG